MSNATDNAAAWRALSETKETRIPTAFIEWALGKTPGAPPTNTENQLLNRALNALKGLQPEQLGAENKDASARAVGPQIQTQSQSQPQGMDTSPTDPAAERPGPQTSRTVGQLPRRGAVGQAAGAVAPQPQGVKRKVDPQIPDSPFPPTNNGHNSGGPSKVSRK
jgi:hypothetical protein